MKKIVSSLVAAAACFGTAFAQERFVSEEAQNRKVVLEEYTGYLCSKCPDGHKRANALMEKHAGKMFAINVHTNTYGTPASANAPDLRTNYGEALCTNAGVSGFPSGSINRHIFTGKVTALDRTSWDRYASAVLEMSSYVNVAAKGVLDWNTRKLELTVQIYYTESSPASTNYLNVAVLQDNIIGLQAGASANPAQVTEDGHYLHHHALRDLITGQWGVSITSTSKGSFIEKTFSYTIPDSIRSIPVELVNLHFVAFVTEGENEIMNACQVELEHKNSPDHIVTLRSIVHAEDEDQACSPATRFAIRLEPRIVATPITSITFEFESAAGITEFEYKPESTPIQDQPDTIISSPIKISANGKTEEVTARITKINGEAPYSSQTVKTEVTKTIGLSTNDNITVHIWQDQYGKDITWELVQADNKEVLVKGGPYIDFQRPTVFEQKAQATLTASCYIFNIYDVSGDGINNIYGEGHLSIIDGNNTTVISNDGKYKSSWRAYVGRSRVANEALANRSDVQLLPNPANDQSVLSFELTAAQNVRVHIMGSNGACALDLGSMNLSAGKQNIELPVSKLAEGLYFVQVSGRNLNLVQKLMIIR
ncbi:MAG: Omp28-related outer membrane protein [Bacteroides sp.]|nr:Omp28-related outer membrane protein [Ruminococcus flavefaciens]MCM1554473.1 Omp28-related outer membrane protein [Bacteroides sp.]